jgi:hypothetical protein
MHIFIRKVNHILAMSICKVARREVCFTLSFHPAALRKRFIAEHQQYAAKCERLLTQAKYASEETKHCTAQPEQLGALPQHVPAMY